jgi:pimeloyl-ACP methyl ester carboxylesterase
METEPPDFVLRDDGTCLAYRLTHGASPTVVFLPGFRSDMAGTKARFLETWCAARGQAYLRFDYRGHGVSSGTFEEGTIGDWAEDAQAVVRDAVEGPVVLVGSSMGGWIMLLVARAMPERVAAILGIAAAPDFTEDLLGPSLSDEQRQALETDGVVYLPSDYDEEPTPLTRALIEEARSRLVLREPLPLRCPVRLLHGMDDPDVPWETALRLSEHVASADVRITLLKAAGHRLSARPDLDLIASELESLLGAESS